MYVTVTPYASCPNIILGQSYSSYRFCFICVKNIQYITTASKQLQKIQNKKHSENELQEQTGKQTESVIFRLYSKDIVKPIEFVRQCLWNKDEISPTPLFSCFFLNIENQNVHFGNLFYFKYPINPV